MSKAPVSREEGAALPIAAIWQLPVEERFEAFCERYLELNEYTGCRTIAEQNEMAEIADAILPTLIRQRRVFGRKQ